MDARRYDFEIDADGYRFLLLAEGAAEESPDALQPSGTEDPPMLDAGEGAIAVATARWGDVPITVQTLSEAPLADYEAWDHVAECGIDLDAGGLIIAGGSDVLLEDAKRIHLAAGSYRVRVSYGGLADIEEEEVSPGDHYRVQLWPGPPTKLIVLNQMNAALAARMP